MRGAAGLRGVALGLALGLAPAAVLAHPHEFVEARLGLWFDEAGALAAIDVEWRYDAFTSMLILADKGLDPAAETLDEDAAERLRGFDLQWIEGYNGDLWPEFDGAPVDLGPPQGGDVWLEDGELVTRHRRALRAPLTPDPGALAIRVYDPEYYVAYSLARPVAVSGREDCAVAYDQPDLDAAQTRLEAAIDLLDAPPDAVGEAGLPYVGRDFAEIAILRCGPGAAP